MLARATPFPALLLAHLRQAWYGFRDLACHQRCISSFSYDVLYLNGCSPIDLHISSSAENRPASRVLDRSGTPGPTASPARRSGIPGDSSWRAFGGNAGYPSFLSTSISF